MNDDESCSTCLFFSPPVKNNEGHCRRYPPIFRHEGAQVGSVGNFKAASAFPRTIPENWCGEFARQDVAPYPERLP